MPEIMVHVHVSWDKGHYVGYFGGEFNELSSPSPPPEADLDPAFGSEGRREPRRSYGLSVRMPEELGWGLMEMTVISLGIPLYFYYDITIRANTNTVLVRGLRRLQMRHEGLHLDRKPVSHPLTQTNAPIW